MLGSWGEKRKKEENLKDSILEAYVLESLQPVPCQENIGQVGWSDLCSHRWFLLHCSGPALGVARTKNSVLCGVAIPPPSVMHENKPVTSKNTGCHRSEKNRECC